MRAWLALVLALVSFDSVANCPTPGTSCDYGEAYASAAAELASMTCVAPAPYPKSATVDQSSYGSGMQFRAHKVCSDQPNLINSSNFYGSYQYSVTSCAGRNVTYPMGDAALNVVPIPNCVGYCSVSGESFSTSAGGIKLYGMRNRTYLAAACGVGTDSNAPIDAQTDRQEATKTPPPECTALGNGQTGCVRPNGDYCATASTGKTFCWTPGQEGAQVDGEQAQVKGEAGTPVKPPDVTIPDKDWQRTEGHQVAECTGSACKTSNVTNYATVPSGDAKNSTADNNPDGTGNTSGNGKPSSGSGKQGDGDGNSASVGDCITPVVCSGDPIMCAQLRETHQSRCEASDFRTGFVNEVQGADTSDGTGTVDANTLWGTADEGELELDDSGLGWGTSCPAPPEVFGKVLDFSGLCDLMGMIGLLVLAIAHLHALYIFMGD